MANIVRDAAGDDRYVSLNEISARWGVARSTAVRVLQDAGVSAYFLSGKRRGVRRYRLEDVIRFERTVSH